MGALDNTPGDVAEVVGLLRELLDAGYTDAEIEVGDVRVRAATNGGLRERSGDQELAAGPQRTEEIIGGQRIATAEGTPGTEETAETSGAIVHPDNGAHSHAAGLVPVRAPMVGTFYRAGSPEEAPFVEEGTHVDADTVVCIMEVMKLFHSVRAGQAGTVESIVAQNAQLAEFDAVLMWIKPDAHEES